MDDVENQVCNNKNKFPRITNVYKVGHQKMDDEDDSSEAKRMVVAAAAAATSTAAATANDFRRFCGLPSSRIVRVSRASGGKDRHSKVWTSKGLRDRRVRLSVSTAIQFYDLQDRLGYDQPSKAVEWLLRAAESSISELPSLNHSFVDTPPPKQLSDEMRSSGETIEHGFESNELEIEVDLINSQQQQQQQQQKSACSSTSESGGFVVSRSDNRVKARERARGRAVEKAKSNEAEPGLYSVQHQNLSHNSSFTELLTGAANSTNHGSSFADLLGGSNITSTNGSNYRVQKPSRQWHLSTSTTPMDHFLSSGGGGGYSGQVHIGNSLEPFSITSGDPRSNSPPHHHHQFSFVPDNNNHHLVPLATAAAGGNDNNDNYNLNFSVSSAGLAAAGYNRGTLQSNSPSMLPPHLQRFAAIDGSNVSSSYISPGATKEGSHQNHHHYVDGPLQLYYGDANWHSDQKGKGKN